MVTPNEVEAESMTGIAVKDLESGKQAAKFFHDKGIEIVIITLGSREYLFLMTVKQKSSRHLK